MPARLWRLRVRDVAAFVVVTAVVAVVGVVVAREAGWEDGSAGAAEPPLTLSLTMDQYLCETERAWEHSLGWSEKEEDGTWTEFKTVYGWWQIPSMPVRWQVSGGLAPYTLVIDHETEDGDREYSGASGAAQVGCADATVGTSFDQLVGRLYAVDPMVDSGWKTVHAVVTDANGDTAEATIDFYVLLDLGGGTTGDIMRRGETYRIAGTLMTAPADYDVRVGGGEEPACRVNDPVPRCNYTINGYGLVGADAGISLYEEDGVLASSWVRGADADRLSTGEMDSPSEAVDSLIDSLGKLPKRRGR